MMSACVCCVRACPAYERRCLLGSTRENGAICEMCDVHFGRESLMDILFTADTPEGLNGSFYDT